MDRSVLKPIKNKMVGINRAFTTTKRILLFLYIFAASSNLLPTDFCWLYALITRIPEKLSCAIVESNDCSSCTFLLNKFIFAETL